MYKSLIKPLLFNLSAEQAHHFTTAMMKQAPIRWGLKKMCSYHHSSLEKEVMGLKFPNAVGLAAGFDKNGFYIREMESLGFGFVEIGTVTPLPQPGNEKPRLFRLPKDEALINRMGFNNYGVEVAAARIKAARAHSKIIIGGNIGKNKITPNENAVSDYLISFEKLFDAVDYFVVNVSSPNTPNLRELQEEKPLREILSTLQQKNSELGGKPLLLKIAPDLTLQQIDLIIQICLDNKLSGIIATNTTINRDGLKTSSSKLNEIGNGGLSGKPLTKKSVEVVKHIGEKTNNQLAIIGVGGIHTPDDATRMLDAGADLIQLYTGLIYEGPLAVKNILKKISSTH
ncbi:MAG TPA: dihydroorotate dehydrogenase (quinone) [Bacteroidetes bacterium]|nr:dihydroorotate dehydrogenase (quinone) [Bacteroidota bacterium]